jgi:uncharacterized protein YggE
MLKFLIKEIRQYFIYILLSIQLLSLLSIVLFEHHNYVLAQTTTETLDDHNKTNSDYLSNNTLIVSGSALAKVKPDLVTISIGVETTNKTAKDALVSNSLLINKVISSLKNNGVKDNEISTSQYTVNPKYNYSQSGNVLDIVGFTVTNALKIQSMNLNNTAKWIDSAVGVGANTINNIDFGISAKALDNIKSKLIQDAIATAKQNALSASLAVGSNIVGIKSIMVDSDRLNLPQSLDNIFKPRPILSDSTSANSPTSIIPGQLEVSVLVNIVYLIN